MMEKVVLQSDKCIHCGACRQYCPFDAIDSISGRMYINYKNCTGCGKCIKACYLRLIKKQADTK